MGEKVAVLLCGYGEVDEYDEFAEYNERSFRLLVSKSIKFPDFSIPFLSRRLERQQRKEWHAANHYHSPHNDIFERQREGIERALQAQYGDDVAVFKAFNFVPPWLPEQVLADIRSQGFEKIVVYPWLVVDSVFTSGLALEQINEALAADPSWVKDMRYLPSFWERDDFQQRLIDQIEEGDRPPPRALRTEPDRGHAVPPRLPAREQGLRNRGSGERGPLLRPPATAHRIATR